MTFRKKLARCIKKIVDPDTFAGRLLITVVSIATLSTAVIGLIYQFISNDLEYGVAKYEAILEDHKSAKNFATHLAIGSSLVFGAAAVDVIENIILEKGPISEKERNQLRLFISSLKKNRDIEFEKVSKNISTQVIPGVFLGGNIKKSLVDAQISYHSLVATCSLTEDYKVKLYPRYIDLRFQDLEEVNYNDIMEEIGLDMFPHLNQEVRNSILESLLKHGELGEGCISSFVDMEIKLEAINEALDRQLEKIEQNRYFGNRIAPIIVFRQIPIVVKGESKNTDSKVSCDDVSRRVSIQQASQDRISYSVFNKIRIIHICLEGVDFTTDVWVSSAKCSDGNCEVNSHAKVMFVSLDGFERCEKSGSSQGINYDRVLSCLRSVRFKLDGQGAVFNHIQDNASAIVVIHLDETIENTAYQFSMQGHVYSDLTYYVEKEECRNNVFCSLSLGYIKFEEGTRNPFYIERIENIPSPEKGVWSVRFDEKNCCSSLQ